MGQAQPTLKEQIRAHKREITRAIREIDRERVGLERQQQVSKMHFPGNVRIYNYLLQTLEGQLRKAAKQSQTATLKIMAKDYVRTKRNIQRFHEMRTQLQGVSLKIQTMSSVEAMNSAMRGAAGAMTRMNAQMRLPGMQRIARQFAMESERMEMNQEMMSDAVDDAMEGDEDDLEEGELIDQVLGELNIGTMNELGQLDAPSAAPASTTGAQPVAPTPVGVGASSPAPAPGAAAGDAGAAGGAAGGDGDAGGMSELERRLNNLRK